MLQTIILKRSTAGITHYIRPVPNGGKPQINSLMACLMWEPPLRPDLEVNTAVGTYSMSIWLPCLMYLMKKKRKSRKTRFSLFEQSLKNTFLKETYRYTAMV